MAEGIFDKEYNELSGELYFNNSHMYGLLQLDIYWLILDIETLMMAESIEMSKKNTTTLFKNV